MSIDLIPAYKRDYRNKRGDQLDELRENVIEKQEVELPQSFLALAMYAGAYFLQNDYYFMREEDLKDIGELYDMLLSTLAHVRTVMEPNDYTFLLLSKHLSTERVYAVDSTLCALQLYYIRKFLEKVEANVTSAQATQVGADVFWNHSEIFPQDFFGYLNIQTHNSSTENQGESV